MNNIQPRDERIYKMYLDYFNNFLTVKRWCEYYNITASTGNRIIRYFRAGHTHENA